MAARKRPLSQPKIEEMRRRIQATLLLKKLEDHVLNGTELAQSQIKAAQVLLGKCMPDLSAVTLSGDPDNPLEVVGMTKEQRDAAVAAATRADS